MPGAYVHTDYDFKKPGADLMAQIGAAVQSQAGLAARITASPARIWTSAAATAIAAIRREEIQAAHQRMSAVGTVRGLFSGCTFKLRRLSARRPEPGISGGQRRIQAVRSGLSSRVDAEGENFKVVLGSGADRLALSSAAHHAAADHARAADGDGRRSVGRGNFHRRVCAGEGPVPLGPARARRTRTAPASCACRRPGPAAASGFIQIPRIGQEVIVDFIEGDPGPADHHRPHLQRLADAALRPAGQRHAIGLEIQLLARRRRLQRADVRGQGRLRTGQFPGAEGPQASGQERPQKLVQHDQSDRIDHDAKHSVGHNLDEDVGNNKTVKVGVDQTTNIGSTTPRRWASTAR